MRRVAHFGFCVLGLAGVVAAISGASSMPTSSTKGEPSKPRLVRVEKMPTTVSPSASPTSSQTVTTPPTPVLQVVSTPTVTPISTPTPSPTQNLPGSYTGEIPSWLSTLPTISNQEWDTTVYLTGVTSADMLPLWEGYGNSPSADQGSPVGECTEFVGWQIPWLPTRSQLWLGDAEYWLPDLRGDGYPISLTPVVGDIVEAEVNQWAPLGHVAVVVSVSTDTDSFVVAEMNVLSKQIPMGSEELQVVNLSNTTSRSFVVQDFIGPKS